MKFDPRVTWANSCLFIQDYAVISRSIIPARNDCNSSMTSDRQIKIREWARNTPRRFSIVFSASIRLEIPVDLKLSWTTISISFSLSTRRFSHQNKNVRTLYTTVECSFGYISCNFELQQTRILAKGREKVKLAVRVRHIWWSTPHERKFTAEWVQGTNGTRLLP